MRLAVAMLLAGCSAQAPADLVRIMEETHKRVETRRYWGEKGNWYARDFRVIPEGEVAWGNCSTFAATAMHLLKQAGHRANYVICNRHVFTASGGFAFDSRYQVPVPVQTAYDSCK